jgi:hypothetical protein
MVAEWYYAEQGQHKGPVTFEDLKNLAAAGRLRPTDLVWKAGWPQWAAASAQPGLFAAPAAPPVAPDAYADEACGWAPPPSNTWGYRPHQLPRPQPEGRPGNRRFLAVGIAFAVVVIAVICGVAVAVVGATAEKARQAARMNPERPWTLPTGGHECFALSFNQGDEVILKVNSDFDSDVDLFVFGDARTMDAVLRSCDVDGNAVHCVAYDNGPSKDCYVRFIAPQTGTYYAVVANRKSLDEPHRNRANSGKLTFSPVR